MPPPALHPLILAPVSVLAMAGGAALAPTAWPAHAPTVLVAVLIFLVGLAFAGFLWWLAARSFALLAAPGTSPEQIAALRDLPMALPEGTVRAILALIVGVVGLPLLLFAAALGLSDAIAGYVNGIIAGVFGYYFGTRGTAPDTQANRRVAEALTTEQRAHQTTRQEATDAAHAAAQPARDAEALARLERHAALAETLIQRFGPALPPGLLPPRAADMLHQARQALGAARRTPPDLGGIADATAALTGAGGPFATLLRLAAPLLPAMAGGSLAGKTVAVWGLTFKARTDDLRDSPSISIIDRIIAQGGTVKAFDPTVAGPKNGIPASVEICADPYSATAGADVLTVLTEWDDFRWLEPDKVAEVMTGRAVVDGRNLLDRSDWTRAGFTHEGLGR